MRKRVHSAIIPALFLIMLFACSQNQIHRTTEIAPPITPDTEVGIGWFLNYADENFIIFQGDFGLIGYDLTEKKITFAMDLEACVGAVGFQGSDPSVVAIVRVTPDGRLAQVYAADGTSDTYYINTHEGTYYIAPNEPLEAWVNPNIYEDSRTGTVSTINTMGTGTLSETCFVRNGEMWMIFDGYF